MEIKISSNPVFHPIIQADPWNMWICGSVCFQCTHFPCADWENIYTLSYYHHQIGSKNYYPLLRVWSWNNGMCGMSFYIRMGGCYLCDNPGSLLSEVPSKCNHHKNPSIFMPELIHITKTTARQSDKHLSFRIRCDYKADIEANIKAQRLSK